VADNRLIRIDDLSAPNYSKQQQDALDFGKDLKVPLTADAVLETALKKAKAEAPEGSEALTDFGAMDFLERLQVQVQSVAEDKNLNQLGAMNAFNEWVLHAQNRLSLMRLWREDPSIASQAVDRPVIIAGLPRSGTTHLLNLMAADKRFNSLPLWELRRPAGTKVYERAEDDPRYTQCEEEWQGMKATLPLLAVMHPMHPDHIHEEIELQCPDFSSYILEWITHAPRWRDYYLSKDQTPHYAFMKKGIQTLQRHRPQKRLILKSPQHLEQLPVLRKTFPDAVILVTHRDPVSVIASAATMFAYGARMRCHKVDTHSIGSYWADRVERLLHACVRDRDSIDAEHSIDVPFHEFMAEQQGMLERIYRIAGLTLDEQARAAHADYIASHARDKHGQIAYKLKEDFGIDPAALRERFDFYYDRFNVRKENIS
jgi:hypothetical protein